MEKIKVGSFFKNTKKNPEGSGNGIVESLYHIVGGKKGSSSGKAFLSSVWYGWNYTGKEVNVDNFHDISQGEFSEMTGGHPDWFVQIENPFYQAEQAKEIVGGFFPSLERPICFIDLETTGTDTERSMIVEICVLKIMPDGTEDVRTMLINPGIPIPAEATAVHGITDEDVKGKPTFAAISKALLQHIEGCDIAGFNSNRFDVPLLAAMFERVGLSWDWRKINLIDVRNIFVQKEERTLSAGVKFYLGRNHDEAHSAEADVVETKNILLAQLSRYEDLPKDFKELALYSNYGKEIIDLAGKFQYNEAGEIVFTFGPHIGKPAKSEKGFLQWMLTKDFTKDTKNVAQRILLS